MSYTTTIKEELIRESNHSISELAGFIHSTAHLHLRGKGRLALSFSNEKNVILRHFYKTLRSMTEQPITTMQTKELSTRYLLRIEEAGELLEELGLLKDGSIDFEIKRSLINTERKKREFIRGVFLGVGIISDPAKDYHLEMSFQRQGLLESMLHMLSSYDLDFLPSRRRDKQILYLKKSESIMDFLTILGAMRSALEFENTRILKSVKNDVNRQVNCETANINKTVAAARKHLDCIEYIQQHMGLKALSDSLREVAQLRWEEPELSLKEIGERCDPPLSKSGVNHRLERLMSLCEKLKESS